MSPTLPIFDRPDQAAESLAQTMRLLWSFPNHDQAEEFRRDIEAAKAKTPEVWAQSRQIVMKEELDRVIDVRNSPCPSLSFTSIFGATFAQLQREPKRCHRCSGNGTFEYQGKMRFCGCPMAEKLMASGAPLPDIERSRPAPTARPSPVATMKQLRDLFDFPQHDEEPRKESAESSQSSRPGTGSAKDGNRAAGRHIAESSRAPKRTEVA